MGDFITGLIGANGQYLLGSAYWKVPHTCITSHFMNTQIPVSIIPCTVIVNKKEGHITICSIINGVLFQQGPPDLDKDEPASLDMWVTYELCIHIEAINTCRPIPFRKKTVEIGILPAQDIKIRVSVHYHDPLHNMEDDNASETFSGINYLLDLEDWSDAAVTCFLSFVGKPT